MNNYSWYVCVYSEITIYFKFLNHNQTLNAILHSQQRVDENFPRKRCTLVKKRNVAILHDNVKLH